MTLYQTWNRAHLAFLSLVAVFAVLIAITLSPSRALAIQSISASNLASFNGCNDGNSAQEWHFIINQVDAAEDPPASIHVVWANGAQADVSLDAGTGSPTAHYTTTSNLDSTVTSATAVIYDGWSGSFVLSHGPCATPTNTPTEVPATETPAEVATDTPTATGTAGGGGEETPTSTAPVGVTETIGGEEETPVPPLTETVGGEEETPATTETAAPVEELPSTGASPGSQSSSDLLAAALLAIVLAGAGFVLRRRTVDTGR
jgi:hypothetical protein